MSTVTEKLTPMMRQYRGIKDENPDAILFFRMGDFFEMFFDDAVTASRILGLTLTSRDRNTETPVPMAGFPHHQVERYMSQLIRAGHRVVICDQVEDPATAKGLVERAVTEIVTPGTAITDGLLASRENNYLLAAVVQKEVAGVAVCDVSTGEFAVDETTPAMVAEFLERFRPRELLLPEEAGEDAAWLGEWGASDGPGGVRAAEAVVRTLRPGWQFTAADGEAELKRHFGLATLDGLGLGRVGPALGAAGALLRYLKDVRRTDLKHLTGLRRLRTGQTMFLDETTRRNLELFKPAWGDGPDTSLIHLLDRTRTSPGARRLRSWLEQPLLERAAIEARHEAVAELVGAAELRDGLAAELEGIADLERLLARASCGKAGPRDLQAVGLSAQRTPAVAARAAGASAPLLVAMAAAIHDLAPLGGRLLAALVDDPPAQLSDEPVIRAGYDADLDALRSGALTGKEWIATLQARERARTGIPSLKVGYNKVFGYYLEITNTHRDLVPADYIRKQTLVNAERYVTPDLKDEEARVLGAEERIRKLEGELFRGLRDAVVAEARAIRETASAVAEIDALLSLARVAREQGFVRPVLTDDAELVISDGRHPVVERLLPAGQFVPNDLDMDAAKRQILIITGPNMAGKSTYLRQSALIVLLAQMGSFVPATAARIGLVDRIFTRIGASDFIARGQSTFMVEMQETAAILRNAGPKSLVILDEVGRGTSTFDGLSIAWAVTEYLHHGAGRPRTLFATHYHELTRLAVELDRVENLNVLVKEWNDGVRFLHRIEPGAADRSYGIQVARLAGLPAGVLDRAREVLHHLEEGRFDRVEQAPDPAVASQLNLFAGATDAFLDDLRRIDVNALTPVEALTTLDQLCRRYLGTPGREGTTGPGGAA